MFFFISALFFMLCVLGVLMFGIVSMTKGGAFNEKYGNRMMQARVGFQVLALAMLALAYYSSKH